MNNEKNCFKSDIQVFDQKLSVLDNQLKALNQKLGSCSIERYNNIEKLENWISPLSWLSINVIIIFLVYFDLISEIFIGLIIILPLNLLFYLIFSEFILYILFKIFTSGLSKSAVDKLLFEVHKKSREIKRVTEIREFYIKLKNKITEIYSYKENANIAYTHFNENEKEWNQYLRQTDSWIKIINPLINACVDYSRRSSDNDIKHTRLNYLRNKLEKLPHIFPYNPSLAEDDKYEGKKSTESKNPTVSKPGFSRPKTSINKDIFDDKEAHGEHKKFDTNQYIQNLDIGEAGENFIFEYEKRRLIAIGRHDLADKVRHVSKDNGNGPGYDILSFNSSDNKIFIEVKTTTAGVDTDFYLSDNEYREMKNTSNYFIYRVYNFDEISRKGEVKMIDCSKDIGNYKISNNKYYVKPNLVF